METIKINSFMITGTGYLLTVNYEGESIKVKTYWDYDAADKVDIDNKTYELIGISELRRIK
jgi:hypothetical protein